MTVNALISSDESAPQDANRTLQDIHAATRADLLYTYLLKHVTSGFPSNIYNLHNTLLPFWKIWDDLSADGDLVCLCCRTLTLLHDSHRGAESTKRWARHTVFRPGIDLPALSKPVILARCSSPFNSRNRSCVRHPCKAI